MSRASLDAIGEEAYGLSGVICFESVGQLLQQSQALFSAAPSSLTFDLREVERADSAGVALLVEWLRLAQSQGIALSFRHIPKQMWAIIEISDLADRLPIEAEKH